MFCPSPENFRRHRGAKAGSSHSLTACIFSPRREKIAVEGELSWRGKCGASPLNRE
jgi:hypothetical protein